MMPLDRLVQERQVLCVVGAGGVGKTTTAAALALAAARSGRRALVMTIDPAKRLANALGLSALDQQEKEIDLTSLWPGEAGRLHAMMLDLKASWDDMVTRLAGNPEQQQKILRNPFYTYLSTALAGAQEYIACEQLYTLCTERDYDLIVLDTPPSAHAIDFLEAPGRILDLLDDRSLRMILAPSLAAGKASLRLFHFGERYVVSTLDKMAGTEMLRSLAEFITLFQGMYGPLRDRTYGFRDIFSSPSSAFVIVSTATQHALIEAQKLGQRLAHDGLELGAVVINQLHQAPAEVSSAQITAQLDDDDSDLQVRQGLADAIVASCAEQRLRAQDEQATLVQALRAFAQVPQVQVARQSNDVHDVQALNDIAAKLCPQLAAQWVAR